MASWDRLRDLALVVDGFRTEKRSVDVSSQFTRVTTTVVFAGGGAEGRGEDVTYTAEDHDWFPEPELPSIAVNSPEDISSEMPSTARMRDSPMR